MPLSLLMGATCQLCRVIWTCGANCVAPHISIKGTDPLIMCHTRARCLQRPRSCLGCAALACASTCTSARPRRVPVPSYHKSPPNL